MANRNDSRGEQHHRGAQEGHRFYGNQYSGGQHDDRGTNSYNDDRGQHRDGRRYDDDGYYGGNERRTVRSEHSGDHRGGQHQQHQYGGQHRQGWEQHPRDERGRFAPQHQQASGRSSGDYDQPYRNERRQSRGDDHRGGHPFYGNQYTGSQRDSRRDDRQDDRYDRDQRQNASHRDDNYGSDSGDYFNAIGHSHNDTRGGRQGGYRNKEIHHMDRRDYEQAQRDFDRDFDRHDYGGGRRNSSDSDSYRGGARQGTARDGAYPSYQGSNGIQNHDRSDYRHDNRR